jgi:hypothetical protein
MAKGEGKKLKVFQTRVGFHDVVVASASRAAALRAFGTRRDLFAQGLASVVDEPKIIEIALAHPERPLRRPAGSSQPFAIDPARPQVSEIDPDGATAAKRRAGRPRPKPDRSRLTAAEAALARLDSDHAGRATKIGQAIREVATQEEALRTRKMSLEQQAKDEERSWKRSRAEASKTVDRERRAFERSGGKA